MHRVVRSLAFLSGAIFVVGCSGGVSGGGTTAPLVTVSVSGPSSVRLLATSQFTATVSGTSNQSVTWQVNNVAGGNSSVGTISGTGLYTAPSALPSPTSVTITALSVGFGECVEFGE